MALLPSRYTPEVNEKIIREAARMLADAAPPGRSSRPPRAAVVAVLFPLLAIAGLGFLGRGNEPDTNVPFDRSSVISADATGTTAKVQDFVLKRGGEPTPPSFGMVAAAGNPVRPVNAIRPAAPKPTLSPRPPASADCVTCGARAAADTGSMETLFDESAIPAGDPAAAPVPTPPSALLVNVGTRIPIVLTHDVLTGAGAAPVTATVENHVLAGRRVAVPQGVLVVGEGFSVTESDRVQVVFSALVMEGKTIPLQGLALGVDDDLGLPGSVVRRASKGRAGVGKVLGALGGAASTLSFGLLGPKPDLAEVAAAELAQQTSRDVQGLSRQWSVSDKAVRLKAGTRGVVFLRADLQLP